MEESILARLQVGRERGAGKEQKAGRQRSGQQWGRGWRGFGGSREWFASGLGGCVQEDHASLCGQPSTTGD